MPPTPYLATTRPLLCLDTGSMVGIRPDQRFVIKNQLPVPVSVGREVSSMCSAAGHRPAGCIQPEVAELAS